MFLFYINPFLVDYHVLVHSLAFQQPFLEIVCAQRVGMFSVASDVVALHKRVRRVYDDYLVGFLLSFRAQLVVIGRRVDILVKEHIVAVTLDGVPSVSIFRIG